MEKFLFLDLDDTVFQTRRKCSSLEGAIPASYNLQGEASSYCLPKQQQLLKLLDEQWRIIPTTARTRAAYQRVDLAINFNDGAIVNHGATIINETGSEDELWWQQLEPQLAQLQPLFIDLEQQIKQFSKQHQLDMMTRMINETGLNYYLEVRHNQALSDELQQLLINCIKPLLQNFEGIFDSHLNSNSLTILPCIINKTHAVSYRINQLKQHYGEIITMGMGDSLSDAAFISLCDYAMIPKATQLHQQLMP